MKLSKPIRSNLLFLLAETRAQLKAAGNLLVDGGDDHAARVVDRSGFVDNLNQQIQEGCSAQMAQETRAITMRAVASIATNMVRITTLCRECVEASASIPEQQRDKLDRYPDLLRRTAKCIDWIEQALPGNRSSLAIKLGTAGHQLAAECRQMEHEHTKQLHQKKQPQTQVGGLLIARTIGQMGDALLNISEALLSSSLGQPMDLTRFHALQDSLHAVGAHPKRDIAVHPSGSGKSGGSIAAVRYRMDDNSEQHAIFKNGSSSKLNRELRGIKRWQQLFPGIAPEIFTYEKKGKSAFMLIEHLQGITLERIVMQASPRLRAEAMKALRKTLRAVWSASCKPQSRSAHFCRQTQKRLADVYAMHPDFRRQRAAICGLRISAFTDLLQQAEQLEQQIPAPFTVLAHGDFNIDNILYDPRQRQIHFIDLHRTAQMDVVQDISVFMVSNYRLQIFTPPVRRCIRKQAEAIYTVARQFAESHHDTTFELRLALGLARSFATSTRFVSDHALAHKMFLRAHYLLEQVTCHPQPDSYHIPLKELFDG